MCYFIFAFVCMCNPEETCEVHLQNEICMCIAMLILKLHVHAFVIYETHVSFFFIEILQCRCENMKGNKINVTIRIDKDLWEFSKMALPCSRNAFIERQLRTYLQSIDEITELEKEINDHKQELQAKEEKLEHLKEIRKRNDENEELMKEAMTTVFNIVQEHDEISQSQIEFISSSKQMSKEALTNEIKKHGFKISKYTSDKRETDLSKIDFK